MSAGERIKPQKKSENHFVIPLFQLFDLVLWCRYCLFWDISIPGQVERQLCQIFRCTPSHNLAIPPIGVDQAPLVMLGDAQR